MGKKGNASKWNIKSVQHLTIQSKCHNEDAAENLSLALNIDINIGVKDEPSKSSSYSHYGYLMLKITAMDGDNEDAEIFTITVELKGTFEWQGTDEKILELSETEIIRELSPHGRETVYSLANKMGFNGMVIPLLQSQKD